MSNFPSSLDTYTPVSGTSLLATVDHANQHNVAGSANVNIETKLGVGSGTPTSGKILVGTGNGTSNWSQSWNNGTLGTPSIQGGTASALVLQNGTAGTLTLVSPIINLSSDATGDMYYRGASTAVARLPIGVNGQVLTTNGTTPSWTSFSLGSYAPRFSSTGTIATFTSTSNSPTNITGGSLTVNPTGTAGTVQVIATGAVYDASGTGADVTMSILVNGTILQSQTVNFFATNKRMAFSLNGQKVIGTAGTITSQITVSNNVNSCSVENANISAIYL